MNRTGLMLLTALLPAVLAAAQTPTTAPALDPALAPRVSMDRYRVLSEQNVFLKERFRPATRPSRPPDPPRAVEPPPPALVLTGVAWNGPQWVAFFEDSRSGRLFRVGEGQEIGGGVLVGAQANAVEYRRGVQSVRRIGIGQDLSGSRAQVGAAAASYARPPAPSGGSTGAAAATSPAGAAAQPDVNDILERLRQRRAQQLE